MEETVLSQPYVWVMPMVVEGRLSTTVSAAEFWPKRWGLERHSFVLLLLWQRKIRRLRSRRYIVEAKWSSDQKLAL